ncbi:hypothetical protein SOPP22_06635 [Shewanella sp. OPT22]|nr:hypothetical protein SOPP22_06635 [Shewanella sp. OPT22]
MTIVSGFTHLKTHQEFDGDESPCATSESVNFDAKAYRVDGYDDEGFCSGPSSSSLFDEDVESSYKISDNSDRLNGIKRSIHARNLQRAFRTFMTAKDHAEVTVFGFKRLTSSANGQERFYDTAKSPKHYVLVRPVNPPPQEFAGGYKKVEAMDADFISLRPRIKSEHFTYLEGKKENRTVRKLLKYPSLCPNFIVEPHLNIGVNAGEPLWNSYVQKGQTVVLNQFEQVSEDLKKMHEDGWLHRDIKTNNMAVCKKTGAIKMFDLSSVVKRTDLVKDKVKAFGTRIFSSLELHLKVRDKNVEMTKRQDNYAMLIAMMEATDTHLAEVVQRLPAMLSKFGIYHGENRKVMDAWIDQHVKPEYKDNLKAFLAAPAQVPLLKSVYEIIDWKREPLAG